MASATNGVRRKRHVTPSRGGDASIGKSEVVESRNGGMMSSSGGPAKFDKDPFQTIDEGETLSQHEQQMLKVLQKHKFALNPKQQEVLEKLQRKAAKSNLTGSASCDSDGMSADLKSEPEEKRRFQGQTETRPSKTSPKSQNALKNRHTVSPEGVGRRGNSSPRHRGKSHDPVESRGLEKLLFLPGQPNSLTAVPSSGVATSISNHLSLFASSSSTSPSSTSSSLPVVSISAPTTQNQGSPSTLVASVPYLHKHHLHRRRETSEDESASGDASMTTASQRDVAERVSSINGESSLSSPTTSPPSGRHSSTSSSSSSASVSPPNVLRQSFPAASDHVHHQNPPPPPHPPLMPLSPNSSLHRPLRPAKMISANSGDNNKSTTTSSSTATSISSSSTSLSSLPKPQAMIQTTTSTTSFTTTTSTFPESAKRATKNGSSPITEKRKKNSSSLSSLSSLSPSSSLSSSSLTVAQRTESTSSSFASRSPSSGAQLSVAERGVRNDNFLSPPSSLSSSSLPPNMKTDIYDFPDTSTSPSTHHPSSAPSSNHVVAAQFNNNLHSPIEKIDVGNIMDANDVKTTATATQTTTFFKMRDGQAQHPASVKTEVQQKYERSLPASCNGISPMKREVENLLMDVKRLNPSRGKATVSAPPKEFPDTSCSSSSSSPSSQPTFPQLKLSIKKLNTSAAYKVDAYSIGRDVVEGALTASKDDQFNDVPKLCLTIDGIPPPKNCASICPPVSQDKLNPPTPSVTVTTKKEALSSALYHACISQPITVLRGYASAVKLDLGLFSTRTLVEVDPDHPVEVRTQRQQKSEENWDALGQEKVWFCESSRSHTSVARYAQYQANSFQESLLPEDNSSSTSSPASAVVADKDANAASTPSKEKNPVDSNKIDSSEPPVTPSKTGGPGTDFKMIKFGTNVDLSDEQKWKSQLKELQKLPQFFRLVSPCNMLSHVGHQILGMNSVQLYMKVPGSRTPGHQENNNMCSVNLNIGPGDCEWFAVDEPYWGMVHDICEKHGVNYLVGSWWPILEELFEMGIPVYRFLQSPGDIVWLSPGTIHWVQAVGWCNNIAWNVGLLTLYQFRIGLERYEFNKHYQVKSIVPMLQLSWHLAKNLKISDKALWEAIRSVLQRSLRNIILTIELVKKMKGKSSTAEAVKFQGREEGEAAYYCANCEAEVFNILFAKEDPQLRKYVVHCFDCSRTISSTLDRFVVLTQYSIDYLSSIYDNFTLTIPDKAPITPLSTTTIADFTVVAPAVLNAASAGSTGHPGVRGLNHLPETPSPSSSSSSSWSQSGNRDSYQNLVKPCSIKLEPAAPPSKTDHARKQGLPKFDHQI